METFTLRDGTVVLAKLIHDPFTPTSAAPYPKTYANRTQADRAALKAGLGWAVIQRGRPWFVARVQHYVAPGTPLKCEKCGADYVAESSTGLRLCRGGCGNTVSARPLVSEMVK